MYQIQLSDGRTVRRHAGQLHSRVDDGESHSPTNDMEDSYVPIEQDGGIGENRETQTQPVESENQETQSAEPESPNTTDSALPTSGETPAQEESSDSEQQETIETGGTQTGESPPTVRRSTQNKHPLVGQTY